MLKTYFGEWGTGRLQRLPYLGYHILLMVLIIASIFGAIMLVGTIENIIGGSIRTDTEQCSYGQVWHHRHHWYRSTCLCYPTCSSQYIGEAYSRYRSYLYSGLYWVLLPSLWYSM